MLANLTLRLALVSLVAVASAACAGGGRTYKLYSRSRPAADAIARVQASFDAASGTTRLRLRAQRLPEPSWVRPNARAWRVWARPNEAQPWQLLGQLDGSKSLGPVSVRGRVFELAVTAEVAPRSLGPTYEPTFAQRVQAE
jgi:hypothetical protein